MKNKLNPKRVAARWMAFGVIASSLVGYMLADTAIPLNFHNQLAEVNFTLRGWSTALIIAAAVFALFLRWLQRGVYWFSWLQITNTLPDERQKAVRQRVFERAYGVMLVCSVFFMLMLGEISSYPAVAGEDLMLRLVWIAIIVFISLPSILAAWERDS